ncbi:MAG: hypothetical protein AXA67_05215 [Methylothermaceae bacteria B42]|nr:MAG: hypothetical protein AXA67_05215 [Methylothermaceae bacteria B42]
MFLAGMPKPSLQGRAGPKVRWTFVAGRAPEQGGLGRTFLHSRIAQQESIHGVFRNRPPRGSRAITSKTTTENINS